ncbi:hypothetical protein PGTUg99_022035 [Puccinia graminis f. sp. tritici]|uniref:Uncharacterized protein n=1 Tax=Puccinia graminis f. sp. tritici TaxID=56615 RepID=A0A5B0M9S3_PUCGR|nr:hypothetical protein PGTUg99_022035 [Puccinia graminis f. sp. tritici]
MSVFSSSFAALLSLFIVVHLRLISSLPNPGNEHGSQTTLTNTTIEFGGPGVGAAPLFRKKPFENGPGPQIYPSGPTQPSPPALPRYFAWDRMLHIDKGNVVVVNVQTGEPVYTISQSPQDHRTTIVSNQHGDQLLSVNLKKTARRGHKFRYNTPSGVHYIIDPRGARTDRWYMVMEGKQAETFTYFRGHSKNAGNVYFQGHNKTKIASINFVKSLDKTHWKSDTLSGVKDIVTLEITQPTEIGDQYFIGLWALVKRRIDHYGL